MNPTAIKAWYGQVTTGAGFMLLTPTLLALLARQITLEQAIPAIAAALVGLIWPENKGLATAVQTAATEAVTAAPAVSATVETILGAYKAGITHGMTLTPAPSAGIPAAQPAA